MFFKSISALQQGLADKQYSVAEMVNTLLKKANENSDNALLYVMNDLAKADAAKIEAELDQLSVGKHLFAVPLIYKDNFNVLNTPTTCASKMLANYHSPFDATVVSQVKQAGAIGIGKANMDEFAMGSTNENSAFGAVKNPFDYTRVTGGSSGGSAAVVASGLVPVAFGTDTGGSVRQPAAFCGVLGLKPTYGALSRYGIVAFGSSFDQPGIFSRNAYDAALVLNATLHYDAKDSTSVQAPKALDYTADLNAPLRGKKIGVVNDLFARVRNAKASALYEAALKIYRDQGAELIEVALPNPELCVAAYYVLSSCECSSNLSRFDGVRYGHRSTHSQDLNDMYVHSRTEGFGAEVKRRILLGTFALSAGFFDAYYVKAQKMRREILNQFNACFAQVDIIALPSALDIAPKLAEDFDYSDDMCTITANLAGLPAVSHPVGLADGMPIGLQLIGKHFAEAELLNAIHIFEQHNDSHLLQPKA